MDVFRGNIKEKMTSEFNFNESIIILFHIVLLMLGVHPKSDID